MSSLGGSLTCSLWSKGSKNLAIQLAKSQLQPPLSVRYRNAVHQSKQLLCVFDLMKLFIQILYSCCHKRHKLRLFLSLLFLEQCKTSAIISPRNTRNGSTQKRYRGLSIIRSPHGSHWNGPKRSRSSSYLFSLPHADPHSVTFIYGDDSSNDRLPVQKSCPIVRVTRDVSAALVVRGGFFTVVCVMIQGYYM